MKTFKDILGINQSALQLGEACWKGYRQEGMKKKGDRQVPNCVPEQEEAVNETKQFKDPKTSDADYDRASAESAIKSWKQDMSLIEDHVEFLKRKHKNMGVQLADAQKRFKAGDFRWISQNLYTLGDLF
jgi:hypothetical protein